MIANKQNFKVSIYIDEEFYSSMRVSTEALRIRANKLYGSTLIIQFNNLSRIKYFQIIIVQLRSCFCIITAMQDEIEGV